MSAPTDRVRQLIALATDTSTTEEERRTAAVKACRLIKESEAAPGLPSETSLLGPAWDLMMGRFALTAAELKVGNLEHKIATLERELAKERSVTNAWQDETLAVDARWQRAWDRLWDDLRRRGLADANGLIDPKPADHAPIWSDDEPPWPTNGVSR